MNKHKTIILITLLSIGFMSPISCSGKKEIVENFTNNQASAETLASTGDQTLTENQTSAENSVLAISSLKNQGFYVFEGLQATPPFSNILALDPGGFGKNTISNADLIGKITILNFWATWCPPCKIEMPSIERLHKSMTGYDFQILAISVGENQKTVRDFIAREGYSFPIFLDEGMNFGRVMASQGIPTTYLVDKQGKIFAGVVGAKEYDSPEFIATMRALANE